MPTFPNARYLIGRTELSHWEAMLKTEPAAMVNHGSYADSVLPVIEAGQVELIDGEPEILDGLSVRSLPGHTPGQIGLSLRRQEQGCLIVGDAIHHPVQLVRPEWSSGLCADPEHRARDAAGVSRRGGRSRRLAGTDAFHGDDRSSHSPIWRRLRPLRRGPDREMNAANAAP